MDREKLSLEHIAHCGMLEGPKYHHLELQAIRTQVSDEFFSVNFLF